jgi:hypothetical protein
VVLKNTAEPEPYAHMPAGGDRILAGQRRATPSWRATLRCVHLSGPVCADCGKALIVVVPVADAVSPDASAEEAQAPAYKFTLLSCQVSSRPSCSPLRAPTECCPRRPPILLTVC